MVRPTPNVLFVETFRHHRPGEHVDEVRFHEPVVISAVEIIDVNTPSRCKSVSLSGASSPQTFAVELFVRSGGDTRFKRICHPFLYSSLSSPHQDVQLAVTDHLVIRGTYDSLTMVVYGNSSTDIGQLSKNHDLGSALQDSYPSEVSSRLEDLPEELHPQKQKLWSFPSLLHLHLVHDDQDQKSLVRQLLVLAEQVGSLSDDFSTTNRLVKVLVSAVTSLQVSADRLDPSSSFASSGNLGSHEGQETNKLPQGLLDAKRELEQMREELQNRQQNRFHENGIHQTEAGDKRASAVEAGTLDAALQFILRWIEHGIHTSEELVPAFFPVKRLIGGLAAAQLLCIDSVECYRFLAAGGTALLTDVIQQVSTKFSITTLLALGVVEYTSRFAFGCEALLGWWRHVPSGPTEGSSTGYQILINLLLQPNMQHVAHLASQILHRLRAYELSAVIQASVDLILEGPAKSGSSSSDVQDDSEIFSRSLAASKHLLELLNSKGAVEIGCIGARFSRWLMLDTENGGGFMSSSAAYGATSESSPSNVGEDIDPFLLSVLQERRLLPMLAALVSSPRFRSSQDYTADLCVELVGVIEGLILTLLNRRSGVLFLTSDIEAAIALLDSFQRTQEVHEKDLPPVRHSVAVTDAGYLCKPQDIGATLQISYSVMSSMDRLLTPSSGSHDPLWALWQLCRISRHAVGKQAVLMMAWFPEVIRALVGALTGADSNLVFGETWKRPAVHLVAKIFQVLVSDPAASSVTAWIPYATVMHQAMGLYTGQVECSSGRREAEKNRACTALIEWLDSALVYQKKGTLGLLKYASAVAAGGIGNPQASAGFLPGDGMDIDGNVGDQAGNLDVPNVVIPFQAKWGGNDASAAALTETAFVQLTVAFRILSLVSSYPGMAAVLYGEGAMVVVQSTLNHCATALTTVPNDYDILTDEDVDEDAEDLSNHKKERLVLRLLLPILTFLLTLCRSLEHGGVEEYQNSKLVDVLLALHHCISARSATYASVPPHTWTGITQELVAVHHVLASVLVCWPVFGWAPALLPRLLGANKASSASSSVLLPMEPGKTCSVLSLLADMLPQESSQTCNTKTALVEMYRSLNVGSTLGLPSAAAIRWHRHTPHVEKLLRALSPHLDNIAEIVLHHSSTICGALQGMLKLFVIRLACKSVDHAAVIIRPILGQIRNQTSCSVSGIMKERKLQVNRVTQMVAGLALHPATKQVLLRAGAVEVLVKYSENQAQIYAAKKAALPPDGEVTTMGSCRWIIRAFAALCDPDVSMRPSDSLGRRILCDCPSFGDCCSIASCLLTLMRVLPLDKELENVLEVFGKFASHKLGRAAVASTAMALRESLGDIRKNTETSSDASLAPVSLKSEDCSSSVFLDLWRRTLSVVERDQQLASVITSIIRHSALSGVILSAAGKSACGMGALKLLFGVDLSVVGVDDDKVKPVVDVIAILEQYLSDQALNKSPEKRLPLSSAASVSSLKEACTAQVTMLRILKRTESVDALTSKVEEIARRYSVPRIYGKVTTEAKVPRHISALSALVSLKENLDVKEDILLPDETLPAKESGVLLTGDSRGKLVWECPAVSQDRPALGVSSSKRKTISMVEVGRKRYRSDSSASFNPAMEGSTGGGVGRIVPASASSIPAINRRDMFRQRKPNTSRPPSMHVDDYVARERNTDGVPSGTNPPPIQQRSNSGSGRPPSIHVDEFMARQQQERQQFSAAGNTSSELQRSGRNLSFTSIDSGRKEKTDIVGKVADDGRQVPYTQPAVSPAVKEDVVKHEISVVESAAVGPSAGVDLPEVSSSVADAKPERTPSSSASVSAATDSSNHGDRTPQVADMMLLQSKVTLKASVSQSVGLGSASRQTEAAQAPGTSGEEQARVITRNSTTSIEMQALTSKIQGIMPRLASLRGPDGQSGSRMTSDEVSQAAQREPELLVSSSLQIDTTQSSFFPTQSSSDVPTSYQIHVSSSSEYGRLGHAPHNHAVSVDSQPTIAPVPSLRESGMPLLDFQGRPINLASLVRDVRHLLPTSGRTEAQPSSQKPPPVLMAHRENSSQVNTGSRGVASVDRRTDDCAVATDPRLGYRHDSAFQATDPRPRPPSMLREKRMNESPVMVVQALPPPPPPPLPPPPPPPSWGPTEGSQRNESTTLPPPPPPWGPTEGSQWNDSTMVPPPQPSWGPTEVIQRNDSNMLHPPPPSWGPTEGSQRNDSTMPPPPPPSWGLTEGGQRNDFTMIHPPPNMMSPRPNPPNYGPHQVNSGVPRAPAEIAGPLSQQAPGTSWSGQYPGTRFFEDAAMSFNTPLRPSQPQLSPPLGQSPPMHGMGSLPSPLPPQHAVNASNMSMENRAGSQVPAGDRRYAVQLQGYPIMSPPPVQQQPTTYIAPPVPAGRPVASQVPVNVTPHQQYMQLQQQNIVQQQFQQQQHMQARQLPLQQQHTAPQHVQQQMHGPQIQMQMPMPAQGLALPPPPPPPPLPPPLPQQQQLRHQQQQESSAFLQQMLASPDAIQALLRDQNKLRELLEQHPKLISLLQEKMSQGPSQ